MIQAVTPQEKPFPKIPRKDGYIYILKKGYVKPFNRKKRKNFIVYKRDKVIRFWLKSLRFKLAKIVCTLSVASGVQCGLLGAKAVPIIKALYKERFGDTINDRQARNYAQELAKKITAIEIFKSSDKEGWIVRIVQRKKSEKWVEWIVNERKWREIKKERAHEIVNCYRKYKKKRLKKYVIDGRLLKDLIFGSIQKLYLGHSFKLLEARTR